MENQQVLIDDALEGNEGALEKLLESVQDSVFNLSLRMLGTVPDAEDATQEILTKALTHLSSFRKESSFSTWVYRIALNHLATYRKGLFAHYPVNFDLYGEDISSGRERDAPDLSADIDRALLEQELKLSCMNGMLQCLDVDGRAAFILGTMFKLDSRVAGDALNISPEAYRQRLSRARSQMATFLSAYCGHAGGNCNCARRINYAAMPYRIEPQNPCWSKLESASLENLAQNQAQRTNERVEAMESLDDVSGLFASLPAYRCPAEAALFAKRLVSSRKFVEVISD